MRSRKIYITQENDKQPNQTYQKDYRNRFTKSVEYKKKVYNT